MAKYELKFLDCIDNANFIKVKKNEAEYGTIEFNSVIVDTVRIELSFEGDEVLIDLDKSTAIKFAKTLRTEINKIKEVQDGE